MGAVELCVFDNETHSEAVKVLLMKHDVDPDYQMQVKTTHRREIRCLAEVRNVSDLTGWYRYENSKLGFFLLLNVTLKMLLRNS